MRTRHPTSVEMGSKGGKARMAKLDRRGRKALARKAALARWRKAFGGKSR